MARPAAARGLKLVISNPQEWNDQNSCRRTVPTLSLPAAANCDQNNGRSASPNLFDKSPLQGIGMSYEFEEGLCPEDTQSTVSTNSCSPSLTQTSAERALAEYALVEEIHMAQRALDLFLNNRITEARRLLEPNIDTSMYAATAHSVLLYLQAIMTVSAEDAKAASKALRDTQALCAKRCRGRFSRSKRTEEQVHAELCHAECGLMLSALVLSEDPGLTALVKSGIRFKSSHSTYQTCANILRERAWHNQELRRHFESGVRLGTGSFNLIFSCVPSKHAKYLSMVGFSGQAKVGNAELKSGADPGALRGAMCALTLIGWETYGKIMLGSGICDVDFAGEVLSPLMRQYPSGAVTLFLAGRVAQLRGQFTEALDYFNRSMRAQSEWKQYQHLCMWESMWCHCFTLNYLPAAELAHALYKENQWSKTTYAYLTACFLLMLNQQEAKLNGETVTINEMLKEVIARKQKIAGHTIPPEKLAEKRYKRYIEQEKDLVFPAFEMSYVWGGMSALHQRPDIVQDILAIVDGKIAEIGPGGAGAKKGKGSSRIHSDSIFTLKFFRGVCLAYLNRVEEATGVLDEIVNAEQHISEDKFLCPYASVELAQMFLRMDDLDKALRYANRAMEFKNYFLQAKVELRIGATIEMIEEREESLLKSPLEEKSSSNEFYTPPSSPEP
ncbi:tetratricopeptide repeat protein 39B-like [Paramacrobiotus metropolitanus]|uniref:tetratricopeptide repeat protein 39B-like n=1 Tax=Paramacrobiotus metropolitanus TaxID=2943436 RepID=UPI0024458B97|nr:tetratricopeptide repeat protein 39B-like [Paramacrobiotus metropolitanus]